MARKVIDHANEAQYSVCSLSFGGDAHHFNDCGFGVAAAYLPSEYAAIDELLAAGEPKEAQRAFGRILHAVFQRFGQAGLAV